MVRILIAVLFTIVWVDGFSQTKKTAKPKSTTLFSVGKQTVTTDEFIYLYKKNHQNKEDLTQPKIEEYLQLFINFKLKVMEARERGSDTTAVFLKEYNSYKDELRKPYLPEGKILDSLVKITYSRLQEEVRVAHILINTKPDASPEDTLQAYSKIVDIKNKALAGEDFGSLAALYSEEPNARTSKGELGYFTAMQMVYPFENAAYSGKPGDIVGPVRTRFGYHILKIEDRKPARGEVEVSHIMIRTSPDRDASQSKNLIFEIHDQLSGGVAWEELCKQYSEDPGTKNSGGKLRPFGVGAMATVPEFDRVAFFLQNPGDISDPFQTQYGWHIIRLERKIPLPTFKELAPNLRGRVARDERTQISHQALLKKLKKDFNFQENQETKTKVFALADTSLIKGKWRIPSTFSENKAVLFSCLSGRQATELKNVIALDFFKYLQENQKATSLTPDKYVNQLYTAFVEKIINEVLEAQIIASHPEFVYLLKEYYEGILLFDIMEKEVWKKASEDSLGQQNYFRENEQKYLAGERVVADLYSSATPEGVTSVKVSIEQNDTLAIQKLSSAKSVRQETGIFQKEDRPILSEIDWKPGLYTVENNGIYYLVQVKEMKPPGPLTFEEARASIISDYQDHLEKTWLEQLKRKYPVKINEKAKKYVVQELKP